MGLKDVWRGKRRVAVTEPAGEPWRPVRLPGEDTVEIFTLLDELDPDDEDEDGRGAELRRPLRRD